KPKEIAEIPGVDLVLGATEKFNITEHLKELTHGDSAKICSCEIEDVEGFHSSFSLNHRTRTFLKVQDGCDYNCSFCTIPLARGKSRSNTIENVLTEIKKIAEAGVKEIVLTGINLGDFGKNGKGEKTGDNFYSLLQVIEKNDGVERYRISSIEPNLLTDEIIHFVANSKKIMPHFHIPLQSGSNKILGLMRRRYRRELYAEKVAMIKNLIPDCCIGVDVITGFPGETDADFKETIDFLISMDVSYFHVFTYSERANTHALEIEPVVPIHIRNERTRILRSLSYKKMQQFMRQHSGETRKVLFEGHHKNGMMEGYTDNYIKVSVPFKEEWSNEIMDWKI
ncbi:MAG TPA: MiaB/RimO family radical SAM methylthiotransferase, partial [Hanamia sp.]|nr:MiaB/RimO family radical SAM methylthiotransferase [Hanamia sp.]